MKAHDAEPVETHEISDATKDKILSAAEKLFAHKGFAATSVKDICDAAGANIAAVTYHFDGKENLYRRIIQQFAGANFGVLKSSLATPASAEEFRVRLTIHVEMVLDLIASHTDVSLIIVRDIGLMKNICKDVFESTFMIMHDNMVSFLAHAKSSGFIRKDADPFFLAGFLNDMVISVVHNRDPLFHVGTGDPLDPAHRSKWVAQMVSVFLGGVLAAKP